MKIAEALLLRKQLEAKVKQLEPLKMSGDNGVYQDQINRVKVTDEVDQITMKIARIDIRSVTADYDHYASQLRKLDAAIQQANWQFEVSFDEGPMPSREATKEKKAKK